MRHSRRSLSLLTTALEALVVQKVDEQDREIATLKEENAKLMAELEAAKAAAAGQ